MKLYLAHPIDMRKGLRELELLIERRYTLDILNPFYDTGRDDIHEIDSGQKTRWDVEDFNRLVTKDLNGVEQSDGVIAVITSIQFSVGTICEAWHAATKAKKPVYIVTPDCGKHPWLRYIASVSGGQIFHDFNAMIDYFMRENLIDIRC
jgi:nucleoside 2-deoxyribosyltransferase